MRKVLESRSAYLRCLALALLFYPLSILGAQGQIAIKGQSMTIRQAIQLIEKNSDYNFFYNAVDLKDTQRKDINCKGNIENVLKEVFNGSGISYIIKDKEVILKVEKTESTQQQAKKRTVTGTVRDAQDGSPIIGANITLESDKGVGTITDIDGNFSIQVAGKKAVLVVTYIGYKTRKVPVEDLGNIDITMEGDAQTLNEVVVVGSGTQKKVSVTGSITSIKGASLKMPSSSLSNSFAGKLAGVIAKTNSGEPGSGAEFYIRGIGTFGGRTTPLILLDDVEISSSDLNYVPAENIESFSILKDASATAIYGARGANGVMIVTTKGGEYNSKTSINVTAENSFNYLDKFPDFVDGATFMNMYNKAQDARTPGLEHKYSQDAIDRTASGINPYLYPDVNWKDVIFKNMSMRQRGNINISGGGSKVKYFMSLEATHDSGLLNTEKFYSWNNNISIMNYTFQNNVSYKLTPTTTISMNMNAQIRQNKGPNVGSSSIFNYILLNNPVEFPVTYPQNGSDRVMYGSKIASGTTTYPNPYAIMNTSFAETNQNTLNTVIKVDQNLDFITKGLKINAWVNFKNWSSSYFNRSISPYYYSVKQGSYDVTDLANTAYELELLNTTGTDYISQSAIGKSSDQTLEMQFNLNYSHQFGQHNVGAMLLYKQREYRSDVLPNRNQGVSGRLTYDYGQRYLAEFNFGYNGTERLAKKDRFGFFPAMSLGWVISNEAFFEPLKNSIDNLKLRGSYGLVGSDDLAEAGGSYYLYIDKIQDNNLDYLKYTTGQTMDYQLGGPMLTYYAQKGLTWEKVKKLDIGLDITLFRDFTFTIDYFYDKRYDIFMNREAWPQSLAYHVAKPWSNIGKMDNKGVEFSINYDKIINKDLRISLQGNFTYNQNKLVYVDEPNYPTIWKTETGKPYSRTQGYIAEGLFKSQEEIDNSPRQNVGNSTIMVGDIKYRDLNGDGIVNSDDQCMISKYGTTPRLQYGFGGTVNYKNFDFGFFFTGSALRTIMANGVEPFQSGIGLMDRNVLSFIADNYFDEEKGNFDAAYPRLGLRSTDTSNNTVNSTYWMRNGSFLRLKNVELGYKIPYGRVFVSGANLATFSPFKLWDPELSSWNSYPLQKTVNVGIQLNF